MQMTHTINVNGHKYLDLTPDAEEHFKEKALKRKRLKDGMTIYYKVKGTNYPCRVSVHLNGVFNVSANQFVPDGTGFHATAELVPFWGY